MDIAISGAGIAGPTLAYWLQRFGHDVVLIEQASRLRSGGYIVDFWGVGYDIAEKMGVLPAIRDLGYRVQEVRFVDRQGRTRGGFPTNVFARMTGGRFTSVRRSDISAAIYRVLNVDTVFGDSIVDIRQERDGVRLHFEHASPRDVDLVIGADGLHSTVRRLAFGTAPHIETSLGFHVAAFEVQGYRPRDELVYVSHGVAGRQVSRFSMRDDRTLFLFVFHDNYLASQPGNTDAERKAALSDVFAGVGWECPQILAAMHNVSDIYFDRVSQIRLDRWASGRVALVGDAAACVSLLAGEGTGLAMAGAYVLAGELRRNAGDYQTAFARYQELLMPFLLQKQLSAARFASSFAPATALGIAFRNLVTRLLRFQAVADVFVGPGLRDDVALPDYAGE